MNKSYMALRTTASGRLLWVDMADESSLQKQRTACANRNLLASAWRSPEPDLSSPRSHYLNFRTGPGSLEGMRTLALRVCYYIAEYYCIPLECMATICDIGRPKSCDVRAAASVDIASPAEITILVDPIVFGGEMISLVPLVNYNLARQMRSDGLEVDIDAYSRERQWVPLFNSSVNGDTGPFVIRLSSKELLNIDAEGIVELASAPRPDDVCAEECCAPEAVEWFGKALKETEDFTKRQSRLQQLLREKGWMIPPCLGRIVWADMTPEQALEGCRALTSFYALIGAGRDELYEQAHRVARRNGISDYPRLKNIISFALENPSFAGCGHSLLHGFCPAGGCRMNELLEEVQNPMLFA
jgi:hypothetical protein